jgi:hypothetical protein
MDIKDVHSSVSTQQHNKVEKLKDEKLEAQPQEVIESSASSVDSVSISPEALVLYNGSGHPDRPKKPTNP